MLKEGQIRIPSGCAISGIFSKEGKRIGGDTIIRSISTMHDRSNGLGGGFVYYGIYPQYKELYAFHIFYDNTAAKEECEKFLERHFDIVNLSKIPVRKTPKITDEPLIWRYFVAPLHTKLVDSQLDEKEFVARSVIRINTTITGPMFSPAEKTWVCSRRWASPRMWENFTAWRNMRDIAGRLMGGIPPILPAGGEEPILCHAGLFGGT